MTKPHGVPDLVTKQLHGPAGLRGAARSLEPVLAMGRVSDSLRCRGEGETPMHTLVDCREAGLEHSLGMEDRPGERYVLDALPVAYFVLDGAGTILSVSRHGAAKLGYLRVELIGENVVRLFHPDDRQAVVRRLRRAARQPDRVLQWDARRLRRDGAALWCHESLRLLDQGRERPVFLLVGQEIGSRLAEQRRLVRQRRRVGQLTVALTLAEEQERRRIATDLHDCVGQHLALAKIKLGDLEGRPDPADLAAALADIRAELDIAIRATRSLTFELSSPVLHELGLAPALAELGDRIAKSGGLRFEIEVGEDWQPLARNAQVILYRIAEELLVNVAKHARARHVQVALARTGEEIRLTIEDDGAGLDAAVLDEPRQKSKGLGILSVRERVRNLGGRIQICRARETGGTRIVVSAPVPAFA